MLFIRGVGVKVVGLFAAGSGNSKNFAGKMRTKTGCS